MASGIRTYFDLAKWMRGQTWLRSKGIASATGLSAPTVRGMLQAMCKDTDRVKVERREVGPRTFEFRVISICLGPYEGKYTKICRNCAERLPATAFSNNKHLRDGYQLDCKECEYLTKSKPKGKRGVSRTAAEKPVDPMDAMWKNLNSTAFGTKIL